MATLQDQLLKAGLVNNKQAKEVSKEKRKENRRARRTGESEQNELKQSAQAARAEKAERDRALNRQRQLAQEEKAIAAQIKQLIRDHSQPRGAGSGDVEYNFTDQKRIKKIRVAPAIQRQLTRGHLSIVRLDEDYALVPKAVAEKIATRDPSTVVVSHAQATQESDEDDPYKDYVIPEDLMW